MKLIKNLPVLGFSIVFVSCGALDKLNQPISDAEYNPLDLPGFSSGRSTGSGSGVQVNSNNFGFKSGDIVEVVIPNTALFDTVPKTGDSNKKELALGDTLRVIGGEKDFIKVVTESGEIGFVSSVMVVTKGVLTDAGTVDPNVTKVGANETPIIPDIAPDPILKGIGEPDVAPGIAPAPVPKIDSPLEVVPSPVVPDPEPVVPSIPDEPAPEPSNPGLPQ